MTNHYHFTPILNQVFSVPNHDPKDNTMRLFIPIKSDHNTASMQLSIEKTNFGIYFFNYIIEHNPNDDNLYFCCAKIKNVYSNKDIKIIVNKVENHNNATMGSKNPGNNLLYNFPIWDAVPGIIQLDLNDYLPNAKTIASINWEDILDVNNRDSCTIPPNGDN